MKKLIVVACAAFALAGCNNGGTGGSNADTDYEVGRSTSTVSTNTPYTGRMTNSPYADTNQMQNQGTGLGTDTGGVSSGTGSSTNFADTNNATSGQR